ncbi:uncharacterized protein LOC141588093 [Silene latifolia]|uniref:uncharacterized protein LOC141588093 n=1 Tax=Silene latifolia TaxID=37657 RepID=UPI003D7739BA
MIFASWNIRGLNDPLKQKEIFDFLLLNKVDCSAILETRVKGSNAGSIAKKFTSYSLVDNYNAHYNVRIWVMWNPRVVSLTVLSSKAQFIHCAVTHVASQKDLWEDLMNFDASITSPWACLGDFNVVLSTSERVGGVTYPPSVMKDFDDCLDNCRLSDHSATGCYYTWTNNQGNDLKWAKLDRILVNVA